MNDDQARCVAHEVARSTRAAHEVWHAARALRIRCACGVFDSYETQLRTVSSVCRGRVACRVGGRRCRIPWIDIIEDFCVHAVKYAVSGARVETDVLVARGECSVLN